MSGRDTHRHASPSPQPGQTGPLCVGPKESPFWGAPVHRLASGVARAGAAHMGPSRMYRSAPAKLCESEALGAERARSPAAGGRASARAHASFLRVQEPCNVCSGSPSAVSLKSRRDSSFQSKSVASPSISRRCQRHVPRPSEACDALRASAVTRRSRPSARPLPWRDATLFARVRPCREPRA